MGRRRQNGGSGAAPRRRGADALPLEEEIRGVQVPKVRRLRALEEENRQLKRIVADQAFNLQVVTDLLGKKW